MAKKIHIPRRSRRLLPVPRFEQPDDVTCGPTCLSKVYAFFGDQRPYDELLATTRRNPDGGTLAVYLGLAARLHGYKATLYPQGNRVFDPTWKDLDRAALHDKLVARAQTRPTPLGQAETLAWADFLTQGGNVDFADFSPELLIRILDRGHPIIVGLSATWLYQQVRERPADSEPDDLLGEPVGHFVVVCGYSRSGANFQVRDPSSDVPFSRSGRYTVRGRRLLNAILLSDVTRDAVLLEIWPGTRRLKRT